MNNWTQLSESDYDRIWEKFYWDFKFKPSYHESIIPAITEPPSFVTFDLSKELTEEQLDEISLLFCSAFRQIIPIGTLLYWLDWQHDSYELHPHIAEEAGFSLWFPDGDYHIFLTEDFSCGTFGHPWQQSLCVFGAPLLNLVDETLRKLLPVVRESKL